MPFVHQWRAQGILATHHRASGASPKRLPALVRDRHFNRRLLEALFDIRLPFLNRR